MIIHRCDICSKDLTEEERNTPFIRHDLEHRIAISILAVDDRGKAVDDICPGCKTNLVLHGKPAKDLTIPFNPTQPKASPPAEIAVLQAPTVRETHEAPPQAEEVYVPSKAE